MIPSERIAENMALAARDGVYGSLIDFETGERVQTSTSLCRLAHRLLPSADELGCTDKLSGVERTVAAGGGANRQRRAVRTHGFDALTDWLAAQTINQLPNRPGPNHPRHQTEGGAPGVAPSCSRRRSPKRRGSTLRRVKRATREDGPSVSVSVTVTVGRRNSSKLRGRSGSRRGRPRKLCWRRLSGTSDAILALRLVLRSRRETTRVAREGFHAAGAGVGSSSGEPATLREWRLGRLRSCR